MREACKLGVNGQELYDLHGQEIRVRQRRPDQPPRDVVAWHMDTVFSR